MLSLLKFLNLKTGTNAQYNKGQVLESDSYRLLGRKRINETKPEYDIYTIVTSQTNKNLTSRLKKKIARALTQINQKKVQS